MEALELTIRDIAVKVERIDGTSTACLRQITKTNGRVDALEDKVGSLRTEHARLDERLSSAEELLTLANAATQTNTSTLATIWAYAQSAGWIIAAATGIYSVIHSK